MRNTRLRRIDGEGTYVGLDVVLARGLLPVADIVVGRGPAAGLAVATLPNLHSAVCRCPRRGAVERGERGMGKGRGKGAPAARSSQRTATTAATKQRAASQPAAAAAAAAAAIVVSTAANGPSPHTATLSHSSPPQPPPATALPPRRVNLQANRNDGGPLPAATAKALQPPARFDRPCSGGLFSRRSAMLRLCPPPVFHVSRSLRYPAAVVDGDAVRRKLVADHVRRAVVACDACLLAVDEVHVDLLLAEAVNVLAAGAAGGRRTLPCRAARSKRYPKPWPQAGVKY